MGNIPAPHLTAISGLNALEAEVINDFTGSYGDNTTAAVAAFAKALEGISGAFGTTESNVGNLDSTWEADDQVITEAAHGLAQPRPTPPRTQPGRPPAARPPQPSTPYASCHPPRDQELSKKSGN